LHGSEFYELCAAVVPFMCWVLTIIWNPLNSRSDDSSSFVPLMIFKGRNIRGEIYNWFHRFAYGFGLDLTF
jgi:hypothetical protein